MHFQAKDLVRTFKSLKEIEKYINLCKIKWVNLENQELWPKTY